MKKFHYITVLLLLILVGCKNGNKEMLDTSKLEKVNLEEYKLTEEEEKTLPIIYTAPSLKVGLDALPFKMKLPYTLPFEALPYQSMQIRDLKHDGKKIEVYVVTYGKDKKSNITFWIESNHPAIDNSRLNYNELKLNHDVIGQYNNNALYFQFNDISYSIIYRNPNISEERHQKEIVNIANQIINKLYISNLIPF